MSSRIRWIRATGGIACFALGAVGAVVPLLPTTVFLLCGSYLLVRSAPGLERQLREFRLFQPYLRYLDPGTPMPFRARLAALLSMWTSLAVSGTLLHMSGGGGRFLLVSLFGLGLAGTCAILMFRRTARVGVDAA